MFECAFIAAVTMIGTCGNQGVSYRYRSRASARRQISRVRPLKIIVSSARFCLWQPLFPCFPFTLATISVGHGGLWSLCPGILSLRWGRLKKFESSSPKGALSWILAATPTGWLPSCGGNVGARELRVTVYRRPAMSRPGSGRNPRLRHPRSS